MSKVKFLVGGEVTWVSRNGKDGVRQVIAKGAVLALEVKPSDLPECVELWGSGYSILMEKTKIEVSDD